MKKNWLVFVLLLSIVQLSTAQEWSYGFRVGLNFSTLQGEFEQDDAGNDLEKFDYNTGFHVGGAIIYKITDNFGVKGELLFNQKGVKYTYEGPSFQFFNEEISGDRVLSSGDRKYILDVTNSYIELPFTGYAKLGSRIEVHGGFHVDFLVGSTAVGEFTYSGSLPGNPDINFVQNLDHTYFKDEPATPEDIDEFTDVIMFPNVLDIVRFPETVGAYYMDYPEKDGGYYNIMDFGLHGGLSFFLNGGLYIGATVNYGLVDVSNDFYDISRKETNGQEYISRSDKDNSFSIQTSVGFSF